MVIMNTSSINFKVIWLLLLKIDNQFKLNKNIESIHFTEHIPKILKVDAHWALW